MSTSLMYHAWGTIDYRVLSYQYEKAEVIVRIEKKPDKRKCAGCGSHDVTVCGTKPERTWKTLPIGRRRVLLKVVPRVLKCGKCGACLQEKAGFAEPLKSYTKRLSVYVRDLVRFLPISHVSSLVGLHQHTVKDIVKEDLHRKASKLRVRHLTSLAIDEIYLGKKSVPKYLSIILDLKSGRVVYVGEGQTEDAIRPFFKRLKRARANIQAVAMDMWEPYRNVVEECFPSAAIVHDPFHIVKMMNNAVDKVRRAEYKRLEKDEDKKYIKGSRYLLLKNPDKLASSSKERLDNLLALNENLNRTYMLKEELRALWRCGSLEEADEYLDSLIEALLSTELKPLVGMAVTLMTHVDGILNYFKYPITTGPLEALNNVLKLIKRKAFGYRDLTFYKLRILFHHETRLTVSGV